MLPNCTKKPFFFPLSKRKIKIRLDARDCCGIYVHVCIWQTVLLCVYIKYLFYFVGENFFQKTSENKILMAYEEIETEIEEDRDKKIIILSPKAE